MILAFILQTPVQYFLRIGNLRYLSFVCLAIEFGRILVSKTSVLDIQVIPNSMAKQQNNIAQELSHFQKNTLAQELSGKVFIMLLLLLVLELRSALYLHSFVFYLLATHCASLTSVESNLKCIHGFVCILTLDVLHADE